MRLLIISDVHANFPALQAMQMDAGEVDFVIHAGDTVGYYPYPNECVEWMIKHAKVNVMGNHDKAIVDSDYKGFSPQSYQVLNWTEQQLTADNLKYLTGLKDTWVGDVGGLKVGVVHGGLTDPQNEVISPSTPPELIGSYFKKLGVKLLITGHTHQMFIQQLTEGFYINPGSVGQPLDQNPNPSYVLCDITDGKIEAVAPKRFSYDTKKLVDKYTIEMLPASFLNTLKNGY